MQSFCSITKKCLVILWNFGCHTFHEIINFIFVDQPCVNNSLVLFTEYVLENMYVQHQSSVGTQWDQTVGHLDQLLQDHQSGQPTKYTGK